MVRRLRSRNFQRIWAVSSGTGEIKIQTFSYPYGMLLIPLSPIPVSKRKTDMSGGEFWHRNGWQRNVRKRRPKSIPQCCFLCQNAKACQSSVPSQSLIPVSEYSSKCLFLEFLWDGSAPWTGRQIGISLAAILNVLFRLVWNQFFLGWIIRE